MRRKAQKPIEYSTPASTLWSTKQERGRATEQEKSNFSLQSVILKYKNAPIGRFLRYWARVLYVLLPQFCYSNTG